MADRTVEVFIEDNPPIYALAFQCEDGDDGESNALRACLKAFRLLDPIEKSRIAAYLHQRFA